MQAANTRHQLEGKEPEHIRKPLVIITIIVITITTAATLHQQATMLSGLAPNSDWEGVGVGGGRVRICITWIWYKMWKTRKGEMVENFVTCGKNPAMQQGAAKCIWVYKGGGRQWVGRMVHALDDQASWLGFRDILLNE